MARLVYRVDRAALGAFHALDSLVVETVEYIQNPCSIVRINIAY